MEASETGVRHPFMDDHIVTSDLATATFCSREKSKMLGISFKGGNLVR